MHAGTLNATARNISLDEKVAFLARRDAYAHAPASIEKIQTHMSWVFLADGYAYKLKKPVHYEFLDFSSVEARRLNCERELELNRRLAGNVYQEVVPLVLRADGRLQLGGDGEAVDSLVKMRRLPAHKLLDAAIRGGTVGAEELARLAELLIDFYRHAAAAQLSPAAYRQRFARGIHANQRGLKAPYAGLDEELIDHLTRAQHDFVARHGELLEARAREARIVDAHGDLRPEHVCLEPAPVVIDCLEFNREFRLLDPVDELAYFAMECGQLGGAEVGAYVLRRYGDAAADHPPPALVSFYKAFRACLRARLAIWHLADDGVVNTGKWRQRAREYLGAAASYVAHW